MFCRNKSKKTLKLFQTKEIIFYFLKQWLLISKISVTRKENELTTGRKKSQNIYR